MKQMSRTLRLWLAGCFLATSYPHHAEAESTVSEDGTITVTVYPDKKKKKKKKGGGAIGTFYIPNRSAIENGNYAVRFDPAITEGAGLAQAKDCRKALDDLAGQEGARIGWSKDFERTGDLEVLGQLNAMRNNQEQEMQAVAEACDGVLPNPEDIVSEMVQPN